MAAGLARVREVVVFESDAFNASEPRPYFINPDCFGDDLARWLSNELSTRGVQIGDVGQEDFGWYFDATANGAEHFVFVGLRPGSDEDPTQWVVVVERCGSRLLRFLLRREQGVAPELVHAIDAALRAAAHVRNVTWHWKSDFDAGRESNGAPAP